MLTVCHLEIFIQGALHMHFVLGPYKSCGGSDQNACRSKREREWGWFLGLFLFHSGSGDTINGTLLPTPLCLPSCSRDLCPFYDSLALSLDFVLFRISIPNLYVSSLKPFSFVLFSTQLPTARHYLLCT